MSNQVNFQNQRSIVQTSFFHNQANPGILFEIFGYLTPQDLVRCSEVCHLFQDITNIDNFSEQKTLWTRLFKQRFPNVVLPEQITKKEFAELALLEKRLSQGLWTSTKEIINSKSTQDPCYADFTSDGNVILAFENGIIRIYDPIENTHIELIPESKERPSEIKLHSPHQILCYYDKKVVVWNFQKGKCTGSFEVPSQLGLVKKSRFIGVTEDQIVFPINNKLGFEVRDLETTDILFSNHQAHQRSIIQILPLKNGKIVTLSLDKTLKVWDVQQKECIQTVLSIDPSIGDPILFETKKGLIFFLLNIKEPCLLDPINGNKILFTEDGKNPCCISYINNAYETQNDKILMKTNNSLYVLDPQTRRIKPLERWEDISNADFALGHFLLMPSDKIMSIARDGTLSLVDLQTKKIICNTKCPDLNKVTKITLTKNQKILALQRTDDANIQSLVTLNFTDSTINILKDLAKLFDARTEYDQVQRELETFFSENKEFASLLYKMIWEMQPSRSTILNQNYGADTFNKALPKQKAYYLGMISHLHLLTGEVQGKLEPLIKKLETLPEISNPIHCDDQFARLAIQDKNAIYGYLYQQIKNSLLPQQDYLEIGEHVFHNKHNIKATDEQRAQAIYEYALELEKKFPSQNTTAAKEPRVVSTIREFTPPVPPIAKEKLVEGLNINALECLSVIDLILLKDYSDALNVSRSFLKQVGISSSEDLNVMGITFDLIFNIDDFSEELSYLCQENTSIPVRHQNKEHIAALKNYVEKIQECFSQKLMTILDIASRLAFHEIMNTDGFNAIAKQLKEIRKSLEIAGSSPQTANAFNSEEMKTKLSELLSAIKSLEKQRLKMMLKEYLKRPYLPNIWSSLRDTHVSKVTLATHPEKLSMEKCYNL